MSGFKNPLNFLNTLFRQQSNSTYKTTDKENKNKSNVVHLDNQTQSQVKIIADNLVKLNDLLNNIYTNIMKKPTTKPDKPEKPDKSDKSEKSKSSSGPTLSKNKQKQIDKAQKDVSGKDRDGNKWKTLGEGLLHLTKTAIKIDRKVAEVNRNIAVNLKNILLDSQKLAEKSITSSSVLIDKNFRSMQLGMGLSNKDAVGLGQSMQMLNIDKGDLAYLTQGQREALSEMTGMFDKLYEILDLTAISELGNDIFMMSNKVQMITSAISTHVQDILTVLDPIIDLFNDSLTMVFDAINNVFNSPEFKEIKETLGEVAKQVYDFLKPVIEKVIQYIQPVFSIIANTLNKLLNSIMPILNTIMQIINPLIDIILSVLMPVLNIISNFLGLVVGIIGDLISFLKPLLDNLIASLGGLLNALMPALDAIMSVIGLVLDVIMNAFKPLLTQIIQSLTFASDILTTVLNILQPIFNIISKVVTELMPVINTIGNIVSEIFSIIMDMFETIGKDLLGMISPILEAIVNIISPILEWMKPILKVIGYVMKGIYALYAMMYNVIMAIRNAVVYWDQKEYLDPSMSDDKFNLEIENDMSVNAKPAVASTYAGSNNTSSISNKNTYAEVNATFNQNISGSASSYAQELQKQNYESNEVLSNLVQGAL